MFIVCRIAQLWNILLSIEVRGLTRRRTVNTYPNETVTLGAYLRMVIYLFVSRIGEFISFVPTGVSTRKVRIR